LAQEILSMTQCRGVNMRLLLLVSSACVASWFVVASPGIGAEKSPQEKTRELLVGKWVDPDRPGNAWQFDKKGRFVVSISAGEIRAHPQGTYRVLEDGSLEVQVRVGDVVVRPRKYRVKVTKDRLTFIDPLQGEASFQRAR